MTINRWIALGAISLAAAAPAPVRAQGASQTVQLAFGYECGDRFLVRNDGTNPVVLEYATAGSQDRSQLHLNGKQSAEIASAQDGNMELWVGGKVVASEPKGNRPCGSRNGGVSVRPADPNESASAPPADSGYAAPPVVVYAPPVYDYYDYYYPFGYPYAYYGYSPFFYPSVSIYARGGFGRGIPRGPIGRGRGHR